jgi:WD40 repeat protein
MKGHTDAIEEVAFFHDGRRIVSCSRDKTLRIWDMQQGTLVGEPFEGYHVCSVAVSPDDRRIACGGEDKTIIIWDVESKQKVFDPLMKHTGWVFSVCFSPDGKRVASGSVDKTVVVWDVETGTVLTTLEGPRHSVLSVAFSPDGLKLASGSADRTIRVWRTDTTELILEINARSRRILWSHDGKQLVSSSNEDVIFWDASTGHQVGQPCDGHDIAISSDGSFIATADSGLTLHLLSTESHQQIGQTLRHPDPVLHCIAISPNGAFLATAGYNQKLFLWFIGDMLQLHDEQEGWDTELDVGQQPRIIELVRIPLPCYISRASFSKSTGFVVDTSHRSKCPFSPHPRIVGHYASTNDVSNA